MFENHIELFFEKYDREAITSIDDMTNNVGLTQKLCTVELFNMQEGFDKFREFITQYGNYKIENINNTNATSQELICENVETNFNVDLFEKRNIYYSDLSNFVKSYIEGIRSTNETVDNVKMLLFENNVDNKSIGDVSVFTEKFLKLLNESFHPSMHKLLSISGYNTHKVLSNLTHDKNHKKIHFL